MVGGEGAKGQFIGILWEGYKYSWPVLETPDQVVNGAKAVFTGAGQGNSMYPSDAHNGLALWLPMWNTIILLSSSVTVHFAHVGLKNDNRKQFTSWLLLTVVLAIIFLYLQYMEYYEAYVHLGLNPSKWHLWYNVFHAHRFPWISCLLRYDNAINNASKGIQRAFQS